MERAAASIRAATANPDLLWSAITQAGELLGNAGVHASIGEMYYWVAAPARGRGVATAAVRLMTAYSFAKCDLPELSLVLRSGNQASIRVAEKSGFTRTPGRDHMVPLGTESVLAQCYTLSRE